VTALLPPKQTLPPGRRVLVVSGSVGVGHDGAARELAERLRAQGVTVEVKDFLDTVPRWLSLLWREGYTASVDHVPGAFQLLFSRIEHEGPIWRIARALCRRGAARILSWLAEGTYDLVVSTYPLASQALGDLRAAGQVRIPVITYLTDPAAHRCWVHPAVDRHLTVTHATAEHGTAAYGVPLAAAGPLVPGRFAEPLSKPEIARLRDELGLPAGRPVALLVGGSFGFGDLLPSVADVARAGLVPLVLCGRNEGLRRELAAVPEAIALGWRTDVHLLLQVADVLVHNAGGLSFTEAVVAGLPAITYRPIPGHGRANAAVLEQYGLAPWPRTAEELAVALHEQVRHGRNPTALGDPTDDVLALLPALSVAA
jgi:processive 1,2-diacylglycerol beta-glucosyltransferase